MGVVVNQSIKNVVITCLGFGLGAINTLFLFTRFMTEEYYGVVTYLMSTSNLIWPLMAFGTQNTLIKFFSSYTDKREQDRFMSVILVLPFLISIIIGILGVLFYDALLAYFADENEVVQPYVWTIFVLAFALAYFELFFAWSKVQLKSVFGNVMRELFLRTCIASLLLLLYLKLITADQFIYGLVLAYIVRLIVMAVYALKLHRISFQFVLPTNYNTVFKYATLILIAGSVATILIDLDKTMIEYYLPIENVAKYAICAYIASVIIIPSRAMHQITYPLTAKLINQKSYKELQILYQKSSINLFIVSGLIFILIICNVYQFFELIPEEYELYIQVVLCIGAAKLFDNLMGNNNAILFSSDYYRLVLYIGIGMAILSLMLNMICIPLYGLPGAALATFSSVFLYNLLKLLVVYQKFKMHPFSKGTVLVGLCIPVFIVFFFFWQFSIHPIAAIVIKSICITIAYGLLVYFFKVSSDVNAIVDRYIKK